MSDYADLNGARIVGGRISIPSYGLWMADLRLAAAAAVATTPGACTITAADLVLTGTAVRVGLFGGVTSARIVGGYGGWAKPVSARYYAFEGGVPLSMILTDAAIEAGERLTGASQTIVGLSFARPGDEPASYVLHRLAAPFWYMRADGYTVVGPRPSAPIKSRFQLLEYEPESSRVSVSADSLADWAPGNTFTSPLVPGTLTPLSFVEHAIDSDGTVRTGALLAS